MTHRDRMTAASGPSVVSNDSLRHDPQSRQQWVHSKYLLASGASAVSGVQAIPVPELAAFHLEPGETLTLRYDLRQTRSSDATASITLKTRKSTEQQVGRSRQSHSTARLTALSMCLPGFRLHPTKDVPELREAILLPGHSALSLALEQDWADEAEIARHQSQQPTHSIIHLPVLAPAAIRVERLLEVLIDGGREASLSIELRRVIFGRREVNLLDRARETLRAREMSLPAEGSDAALVRFQLVYLQAWAVARSGISLTFHLGLKTTAELPVLKVAKDLLFGTRPAHRLAAVDDRTPDLDLSLALATMTNAPTLVLPSPRLDRLGFFAPRRWKGSVDPPAASSHIGHTQAGIPVSLGPSELGRHVYIIGATGVGKSTLMAHMIRQDIDNGLPTVVIDPHGDLFNEIRDGLSKDQRQRACIADLSSIDGGFGLNLLDMSGSRSDVRLNFVCNQLISVFRRVLYRDQPEGFGPMFESYFRNALMLLTLGSPCSSTISDFDRVFGDPKFRADLLANCKDEIVVRFWKQTAVRAGGEAALENIAPYIVSKLTQFTGNPLIRPIIDGSLPSLNFSRAFEKQGILLINLAKGVVGEADAALVGALFTIQLFASSMARTSLHRDQRGRVRLYMDEFQTYASDVLSQMLAECRKFGLELVLANQSLSQINGLRSRPDVAEAILANVGTVLAYRTGPTDAAQLQAWFYELHAAGDMITSRRSTRS